MRDTESSRYAFVGQHLSRPRGSHVFNLPQATKRLIFPDAENYSMTSQSNRQLSEILASGPMHYPQFLDYGLQLAKLLEELHKAERVHCAISASAVQVTPEDQLFLSGSENVVEATPELKRDDLYQVGLIFVQMLSATHQDQTHRPLHPILSETLSLDSPTHIIPVEARLLLEELLAEDPKQRIASAHELVSTMKQLHELRRMPLEPSIDSGTDRSRLYSFAAMGVLIAILVWVLLSILVWKN
jgi:serine/threonine protein kinase